MKRTVTGAPPTPAERTQKTAREAIAATQKAADEAVARAKKVAFAIIAHSNSLSAQKI